MSRKNEPFFGTNAMTSACASIQQLRRFEENLTDFLCEFLEEKELHASESVLAVHSRSRELRIGVPAEFSRAWECYELAPLFREEDGETVPDCDAVSDIAASFFFVR